jgi:Ca2+-binding RTX toxin-like protein
MVTRTYDHDLDGTVNLLGNGDRYVFTRDAYVYADNSWAIYEDTPRKNNQVVIDGILEGADNAGGVLAKGANFELDIGVRGIVSGGTGAQLSGANADIDNSGYIFTTTYGIYSTGNNARIHNNGLIDSVTGIYADGDRISIVNDAGAMIRTSGTGIQLQAGAGDETRTVNHGHILSTYSAGGYRVGASDDTLINDGRITGSIDMGDGDDTLDNRGGIITGTLQGGAGNDVFITDDDSYFHGGDNIDTVKSSADYVLEYSTERLYLLGGGNLDGTGNEYANRLVGNSGNNVLAGLYGNDHLDGRGGNDTLRGGKDKDTFIFATGYDHDRIIDFNAAQDHIDVSGWKATGSFSDLKNNHAVNHGQDVWIVSGSDRLVIEGLHVNDLKASYFEL